MIYHNIFEREEEDIKRLYDKFNNQTKQVRINNKSIIKFQNKDGKLIPVYKKSSRISRA